MKTILISTFAAALLLLAGCASPAPDPRLTLAPGLKGKIRVEPLVVRVNDRGVTDARLVVHNTDAGKTRAFEYRVRWADGRGFPIDTVTGNWSRFAVPPGAAHTLSVTGPSPSAAGFNIYLRMAEN
ncbi:MAG: YcfL family protein [Opitutaceae bacterium]|jgi:uncharacterized protein YcfL|nr:YcfL family protein [Opitutaceae bacterium]